MGYKLVALQNLLGHESIKTPEELLADILYHLNEVNSAKVIALIAQAGGRLHQILQVDGPEAADQELIAAYCPEPFQSTILEIKKRTQNSFLFTPLGFRLVHHLLIHKITSPGPIKTYPKNVGMQTFVRSSSIWVPIPSAPKRITNLSLSGIFLMANELLDKLYSPLRENELFYLTRQYDFTGVVGRMRLLFENKHFDDEFLGRFGFGISSFLNSLSNVLVHVLAKDPMVLSPSVSYQRYSQETQAAIQAAVYHLAIDFGHRSLTLNTLRQTLKEDLLLDRYGRGKPLLRYRELFYCIRPDLLATALTNLPIHMILTNAREKGEGSSPGNRLLTTMGPIFESLCYNKTKEILGEDRCRAPEGIKPLGDLLILITDKCLLIIEAKATIENEKLINGDRREIIKKFLLPEPNSKSGPNPGPLQIMQRATEYRKQNNFDGELYTAVVYLNAPPATSEFDNLYLENIPNKDIYQSYKVDMGNRSTILLSIFHWELILSAVKQGGSLQEILKNLAGLSSSNVGRCIVDWMKAQNMQISSAPIYESEISEIADKCRQETPAS
jgi:hypothetical protein